MYKDPCCNETKIFGCELNTPDFRYKVMEMSIPRLKISHGHVIITLSCPHYVTMFSYCSTLYHLFSWYINLFTKLILVLVSVENLKLGKNTFFVKCPL